jgi:hypothetical protein
MTAHELAKLLLAGADLPVRIALIGERDGDEVTYLDGDDNVRTELQTDFHGKRHVVVVATGADLDNLAWT